MVPPTITDSQQSQENKNASLVLLKMAAEEESQSLKSTTTTTISGSDDDQPPIRPCSTAPSSPEKRSISRPPSLRLRYSYSFNKDLIVGTTISSSSSSYTSLRDLIHTNTQTPRIQIQSPTFCYQQDDLPIRNKLVKHAACAYLLPKASPTLNKERHSWFRSGRDDEVVLDSSCSDGCLGFARYVFTRVLTAIRKRWGRGCGDFAANHFD